MGVEACAQAISLVTAASSLQQEAGRTEDLTYLGGGVLSFWPGPLFGSLLPGMELHSSKAHLLDEACIDTV